LRVAPPNLRRFDRTAIQSAIESRDPAEIKRRIEQLLAPTASLMAWDELASHSNSTIIIPDTAIWHSGVAQNRGFEESVNIGSSFSSTQVGIGQITVKQNFFQEGILQVDMREVSAIEAGLSHISPTQISVGQVGSSQPNLPHFGITQISPLQISLAQITGQSGSGQLSPSEISSHEPRVYEICIRQNTALEVSSDQANMPQVNIAQINISQFDATEIALPSSITFQQFLSSHNFNLQNTTIPTWTEFLTGTTPFNLNIEITDRPTSQLAVRAALR
jgi:hypothetical protein